MQEHDQHLYTGTPKSVMPDTPVEEQARYWNEWNRLFLGHSRAQSSQRQAELVVAWIQNEKADTRYILDVGCGTGWLSARLAEFGSVTAVDLSSGVLEVARSRFPQVDFVAGDFMTLELPEARADVVVSLEVLAHVADQAAFVSRLARCLKPGGRLMLSTQNRFVFERLDDVSPWKPGLIRRWLNLSELLALLTPEFEVQTVTTIVPRGHRGVLRLVNSPKLNRVLSLLLGEARVLHWKERLGFGQTIMVAARRRHR